jgi:hypothetical protein
MWTVPDSTVTFIASGGDRDFMRGIASTIYSIPPERVIARSNALEYVTMLQFAGVTNPAMRLLVLHDDAEREFDHTSGGETALQRAATDGWTVVAVKNDWATVFADVT